MTARVHKSDIDRAIRSAKEGGLVVARIIIRQNDGEIIIETADAKETDKASLDDVEW